MQNPNIIYVPPPDDGKKHRHGCVTAWLILMLVANSITALFYLFGSEWLASKLPGDQPPGMFMLLAGIGVVNVILSFMLWNWKKWGFYGFAISGVVTVFINISLELGVGQSLFGLIGIGILYGILQIKERGKTAWENLE